MRFEFFKDARGEFRWRLLAVNGKIVATSGEGYKRKSSALKSVESIKKNVSKAAMAFVSLLFLMVAVGCEQQIHTAAQQQQQQQQQQEERSRGGRPGYVYRDRSVIVAPVPAPGISVDVDVTHKDRPSGGGRPDHDRGRDRSGDKGGGKR